MPQTPQNPYPKNLVGLWELTGFVEKDAGERSGSYSIIFKDSSLYDAESFDAASGEKLTVTESGDDVRFTMRGEAQVPWTSAEHEEGVLNDSIEDQDGRVVPSIEPYFRLERQVNDQWMSKYSDSDLDMDNVVFTDGPDLVLMVTTVVDELYVTKYFYRFSRV